MPGRCAIRELNVSVCLLLCITVLSCGRQTEKETSVPTDYLFLQRAFPYQSVPSAAFYEAVYWAKSQTQARNGPVWTLAGPNNVGGRITDIAMHASDSQTIYAASASGGVWKSSDAGESWFPITDGLPSLSIGDIAIDPSDKNVLYCGTGEPNGGGGSVCYDGRGVFKSIDGGVNWMAAGLENTGSIGRIEVDPQHPNRVFVAAMGHLFGNNPERGLYRSIDGGMNWEQKLYINDSTGIIDLAINPLQPDTLFAVSWQRVRRPNSYAYGGPASGIYRSTDGGEHWTKLSGGLPQGSAVGRIGIALSPSDPNILYALISNLNGSFGGTYKSSDNGYTWDILPSGSDPGYLNFGWWFGQIRVDPTNPDRLFTLGYDWMKSEDGGSNWDTVSPYLHADYHALYIHPANPGLMVAGNDGGLYMSQNGGADWVHKPFAITQFYTSEIDFQNPDRLYGGAQDNGTWRSLSSSPGDWEKINGGDGFVTLVNPENSDIFYAELQYGNISSTNAATKPVAARYNWNTPYVFDPADPDIMYFGAERLFKSTDGGLSWTAISGDLSNGLSGFNFTFGTITSIAVSPLDGQIIYAGTDDGNVWVTSTGGADWAKISDALPKRWITRVAADPEDPNTAFVCLSGYRHFDDMAHIYRTTNQGQSWTSVSGNLPDVPVNDLIPDPLSPADTWYIATDVGVMATFNAGNDWEVLGTGLPNAPVLDLTLHGQTRTLVAATYGRSMFKTILPLPSSVKAPENFGGFAVFPNPFQQEVSISFTTNSPLHLEGIVWDLSGKRVKTFLKGLIQNGLHRFSFDAANLPEGVYVVQIKGGKINRCVKVIKVN